MNFEFLFFVGVEVYGEDYDYSFTSEAKTSPYTFFIYYYFNSRIST